MRRPFMTTTKSSLIAIKSSLVCIAYVDRERERERETLQTDHWTVFAGEHPLALSTIIHLIRAIYLNRDGFLFEDYLEYDAASLMSVLEHCLKNINIFRYPKFGYDQKTFCSLVVTK